jgi:hypothetical protein
MDPKSAFRTQVAFVLFVLVVLVFPKCGCAQVTDLPAGAYGGQFRDQSTGKVWLDYNVTFGKSLSEKLSFLANTPFRLATTAEIQSIAQAGILQDPATGPYTACYLGGNNHDPKCKYGVFDDAATGVNPVQPGVMGVIQDETNITLGPDATDDFGASLMGAWVIQRGPALRPGTSATPLAWFCCGRARAGSTRSRAG